MKEIDSYLTDLVQEIASDALVICYDRGESNEKWVIEFDYADLDLGPNFKAARKGVQQWVKAHKNRASA